MPAAKAASALYYMSYSEQYNMDFPVAGVCGAFNDPSSRSSMAKGKGLDDLFAGMVAVCALKPDMASYMYEPTFVLQRPK